MNKLLRVDDAGLRGGYLENGYVRLTSIHAGNTILGGISAS
jgi:hypothetical protein